jgi:hypothetical protein
MSTLTCAQAQSILYSSVVDVEQRIKAQSHVLSCETCGAASNDEMQSVSTAVHRLSDGNSVIRTALVLLGVVQLSLALPWILGLDSWWQPSQNSAQLHLSRDGAIAFVFSMAAFLSARWRRLSWFCVVPTALAMAVQILAAIYDDSAGHIAYNFEVIHVIGLAILGLILLNLRPQRRS